MHQTTYTNRNNGDRLIVIHNGSLVEETWIETHSDRLRKQAGSRLNWKEFTNLFQCWTDFNLIAK